MIGLALSAETDSLTALLAATFECMTGLDTKCPIAFIYSQWAFQFRCHARVRDLGGPVALLMQVLEAGDAVVAAARKPEQSPGLVKLKQQYGKALHLVRLDVNDGASVKVRTGSLHPVPAWSVVCVNLGKLCLDRTLLYSRFPPKVSVIVTATFAVT